MPLTLQDDHIKKLAGFMAKYFVENFHSDKIIPSAFINSFDNETKIFEGHIKTAAKTYWDQKNKDISGDDPVKPYNDPYILIQGPDEASAEEKLKSMLPEDKIIYNKQIVRRILKDVDFKSINQARENDLIARLKQETIGLNDQEVFIYYNLVKIQKGGKGASTKSISSVANVDELIEAICDGIDNHISSFDKISIVNENKPIRRDLVKEILNQKILKYKYNPYVLKLITGGYQENHNFVKVITNFLKMITTKWGTSYEEAILFYTMYFLLAGLNESYINNLPVSRILKSLALGRPARLKPIVSAGIAFVYFFDFALGNQVVEINKKFHSVGQVQKQKLVKLYSAQERRQMIINNSGNFALKQIQGFKTEYREIVNNFKNFNKKFKTFLTVKDLFQVKYVSS